MRRLSLPIKSSNEDSDSDESFHCCGRPEDLINDPLTPKSDAPAQWKEVQLPENQEHYSYESGIEHRKEQGDSLISIPSHRASFPRCRASTHSLFAQQTVVDDGLMVIKTGLGSSSFSTADLSPSKAPDSNSSAARPKLRKPRKIMQRTSFIFRKQSGKPAAPISPKRIKQDKKGFAIHKTSWRSSRILSWVGEVEVSAFPIQGSSKKVGLGEEEG